MSDFIREVNEELRQDQFRRFLSRYWLLLLIVALLILGGVGGYRAYDYVMTQRAQQAGGQYRDAMNALRAGKTDEAVKGFEAVTALSSPGYRLLARLSLAAAAGKADPAAGAKQYDAIAADGSVDLAFQNLARLRASLLLVDTLPYAEMKQRLSALADANNGLRNSARELLAVAALKANESDEAGKWLDAIDTDPTTSASLRQRADAMLGLVRAGSGDAVVATAPTPGSTAIPGLTLPTEATPLAPTPAPAPETSPPAPAADTPAATPSPQAAPAAAASVPAPAPAPAPTPPTPATTPDQAPATTPAETPPPNGDTPPAAATAPNAAPAK